MNIYTGYYSNIKSYKGMTCIGISIGTPRWLGEAIVKCPALFPKPWMLKMGKEEYTEAYGKILRSLDPEALFEWLRNNSEGKDIVLLCYEKPGDFCHRTLVAEWLKRELGIVVREYGYNTSQQMELF